MKRDYTPEYSSGRDVEEGVLGKISKEYELTFGEVTSERAREHKIEMLIELVKEFQPFADTCNPVGKPFPAELCQLIKEDLRLSSKQVRYYASAGADLDFKGVDAFFEVDMGGGDNIICPLDITSKETKISPEEGAEIDRLRSGGPVIKFYWPKEGISKRSSEWSDRLLQVGDFVMDILQKEAIKKGGVIRKLTEYEIEESKRIYAPIRMMALQKMPKKRDY